MGFRQRWRSALACSDSAAPGSGVTGHLLAVYEAGGTPKAGASVSLAGVVVGTVTALDAEGRALVSLDDDAPAKARRLVAGGRFLVARVDDRSALLVAR